MRIEESIVVDRKPEEVFTFFDERSNDSRWMSSVIESEWIDPEEPTRSGRRGRMVMEAMGPLGTLMAPFVGRSLATNSRDDLNRLKELLESGTEG